MERTAKVDFFAFFVKDGRNCLSKCNDYRWKWQESLHYNHFLADISTVFVGLMIQKG